MQESLVSLQNRVEAPFVIMKIGDYTFGKSSYGGAKFNQPGTIKVTFPNYMVSLNAKKVNGTVNTYTIRLTYAITQDSDPNLLERIFSSVSTTRKITLQYGDWMLPAYVYKNEEAIITKIESNVDINSSKIDYTITAVSSATNLNAAVYNFSACVAKPSDKIKAILKNESYGVLDIYYGMKNESKNAFKSLIAGDDLAVKLEAKKNISILSYINYLVSCMTYVGDNPNAKLKSYRYFWASFDDISNEYEGPYFKIVRVDANARYSIDYNTYQVDVGYPSGNLISSFTINKNDSWALLYEHADKVNLPEYTYEIDDDGKIKEILSPSITNSSKYSMTTSSSKTWWSNMTQYPISAELTIKGLLRPAVLTSYVKVNVLFYGRKHISSGLYIVTKHEDTIDANGYRSKLSLTRISGDEMG